MDFTDYKLYNQIYQDVIDTRENLTAIFEEHLIQSGRTNEVYDQAHNTNFQRAYSYYLQHSYDPQYQNINRVGQRYVRSLQRLHVVQDVIESININVARLGDSVIATQVDTGKGALYTYVDVNLNWFHRPAHKKIIRQIHKDTNDRLEIV